MKQNGNIQDMVIRLIWVGWGKDREMEEDKKNKIDVRQMKSDPRVAHPVAMRNTEKLSRESGLI